MASITKAVSVCALLLVASAVSAGPLDEMSLERWKVLKEAERFQLTAAERLYRESQWKAAADEYEKFLKLYEKSEGAPYAQLKWSHCMVNLRKQNAAIKDGYQTLLDYFPDAPEAPIAALLIGRTYRDIGDLKPAKKAYLRVTKNYPKHFAGVMARLDLVDIAEKEKDATTKATLLRELTFDVKRDGPTVEPCVVAARQYTQLVFRQGNFDEGIKALATTCSEAELPHHLVIGNPYGCLPQIIGEFFADPMDKERLKLGEKLADAGSAWLKTQAVKLVKNPMTKPAGLAAWFSVGDVRRAAKQSDKQKAVYEEMLATLGPDDAIYGYLAQWYKENKQRDQARATYAKYKDQAEGQGMIAASWVEENQTDKAVAIYRQLAADAKTAPRWLGAAAQAYRQGNKPDQAIAVYRELITSDAKNADSYAVAIADTLYYAQRWADCIAAYRGTTDFPRNYLHMAAANRQLKKYDEAIGLYRQVMAGSAPHASAALYQIALTQEEAGKKEDAIKTLKQICDKFPKSGEGSQAHARLNDVYKIPVTLGGAKD
jgi:TolA-binding protein